MNKCESCNEEKEIMALRFELKSESFTLCYDCLKNKVEYRENEELWFFDEIRKSIEKGLTEGKDRKELGLRLSIRRERRDF